MTAPELYSVGPAGSRPPLPPFDEETARAKARAAEDAWNSRDPERVSLAYTVDSVWRNRTEFLTGRKAIVEFLTREWARELDYRLIKEVWGFRANRMAVRFAYEWHNASGQWFRSYGNENWEFDEGGYMRPSSNARWSTTRKKDSAATPARWVTTTGSQFRWRNCGRAMKDHPRMVCESRFLKPGWKGTDDGLIRRSPPPA